MENEKGEETLAYDEWWKLPENEQRRKSHELQEAHKDSAVGHSPNWPGPRGAERAMVISDDLPIFLLSESEKMCDPSTYPIDQGNYAPNHPKYGEKLEESRFDKTLAPNE